MNDETFEVLVEGVLRIEVPSPALSTSPSSGGRGRGEESGKGPLAPLLAGSTTPHLLPRWPAHPCISLPRLHRTLPQLIEPRISFPHPSPPSLLALWLRQRTSRLPLRPQLLEDARLTHEALVEHLATLGAGDGLPQLHPCSHHANLKV